MRTIKEIVSANVRAMRGKRTQAEMAELAGLPFRTFQSIDSGESLPRPDTAEALARAFGVTESRLFADPDYVATPKEARRILEKQLEMAEKLAELPEETRELVALVIEASLDEKEAALLHSRLDQLLSLRPKVRRIGKADDEPQKG